VTELSHDLAEDGFHEIQLSGKQLVFLFMAGTIVSVFIFLCGVLVGRGARDASASGTAEAAAPSAQATQAEALPPAETPSPETVDELQYHKRLQGETTQPEQLKRTPEPAVVPPEPTEAPPADPAPARASAAPDVPTAGRPGSLLVQVTAVQDRVVAAGLVRKLADKGYPAFLVPPPSKTAPQIYKVQVGRFSDRREAEEVKRRLEQEEQFKPWITSSR
jgi:cell division septation protein DedD